MLSPSLRGRGLKPLICAGTVAEQRSPSLRGRGLKLNYYGGDKMREYSRPPCEGVD